MSSAVYTNPWRRVRFLRGTGADVPSSAYFRRCTTGMRCSMKHKSCPGVCRAAPVAHRRRSAWPAHDKCGSGQARSGRRGERRSSYCREPPAWDNPPGIRRCGGERRASLPSLAPGGFGIGVVAGAQDGNEDRGLTCGSTLRVVDSDGVPGIIHEELFAGLMLLAQHHVQTAAPATVELAEAAVAIALGVVLAVFLPQPCQRQVTMGFEFLVKGRKVGRRLAGFIDAARAMAEQRLFQPRLIPTLGQRPTDARRLGPFQVF